MCQDTGSEARCPALEFVWGEAADGAMGGVAVVVPQPVAHGDGDVVVVMEPPPVGELSAETGVIALDDPVLPGRPGAMVSVRMPRLARPSRTIRAINSGPLSERMCSGAP